MWKLFRRIELTTNEVFLFCFCFLRKGSESVCKILEVHCLADSRISGLPTTHKRAVSKATVRTGGQEGVSFASRKFISSTETKGITLKVG